MSKRFLWTLASGLSAILLLAGVFAFFFARQRDPDGQGLGLAEEDRATRKATPEAIASFCGDCHALPDASIFPKSAWKMEVERGFQFFEKSGLPLKAPPLLAVVKWYEESAPESLPIRTQRPEPAPGWQRIETSSWPEYKDWPQSETLSHAPHGGSGESKTPSAGVTQDKKGVPFAISHLKWATLQPEEGPVLIACDMRSGGIASWNPRKPLQGWSKLARVAHPAHVEVADLDADGFADLLVSDLGSFLPTDAKKGKALWFRGSKAGLLAPVTLLAEVGRVTDIGVIQDRSRGLIELVVAAFGWNQTGEVYYLQQREGAPALDAQSWKFDASVVDTRHGAIHVPVHDWDGDGRMDFVALFGQEHEAVTLYLNRGRGKFEATTIHQGAHPGLGSSGIQQADLDGDGDLDLLVSNGDVLDQPYLLKPYHGVFWLENKGHLQFEHHSVGPMYGVHRALVFAGVHSRPAESRKEGKANPGFHPVPDKKTRFAEIVSVAFLPREGFAQREAMKLESVLWWQPDFLGVYTPRWVESVTADHVACEVGDFWANGDRGIAVGDFSGKGPPVVLYRRPADER